MKQYYAIKDSARGSVKAWLIQNYKHAVTDRVVGMCCAEAETFANFLGVAKATIMLGSNETKSGDFSLYTLKEDDFIIEED